MVVACVVVAALLVAGVLADRHWPKPAPSPSLLDERVREQVIVTLKTGEAFGGLLWEADDKVWVLRDAVAIGRDSTQPNVGVDGEVVVPAGNVAFAQRT